MHDSQKSINLLFSSSERNLNTTIALMWVRLTRDQSFSEGGKQVGSVQLGSILETNDIIKFPCHITSTCNYEWIRITTCIYFLQTLVCLILYRFTGFFQYSCSQTVGSYVVAWTIDTEIIFENSKLVLLWFQVHSAKPLSHVYSESKVLIHLVLAVSRSFSPGHLSFKKQNQVLKYVFIHAVNILPLTDNQTD